jgi:hypothetical protein
MSKSINDYKYLFSEYEKKLPSLSEALNQMFKSTNVDDLKVNELTNDILNKSRMLIDRNFNTIQKKYDKISKEDAYIICSYTCESIDHHYSPYKLLNQNLVSEDKKKGIENISKYLFILLRALRKLTRYYPDKYLYRCINQKVSIEKDPFNEKSVPFKIGNTKTFWSFISASPDEKQALNFISMDKGGTIFTLGGDVWGYDISLFNYFKETEILLEPERSFVIDNVIPPVKDIINVKCLLINTPLILHD